MIKPPKFYILKNGMIGYVKRDSNYTWVTRRSDNKGVVLVGQTTNCYVLADSPNSEIGYTILKKNFKKKYKKGSIAAQALYGFNGDSKFAQKV